MPEVYKQSFKQNYTNNVDLSVFNCGLDPSLTAGWNAAPPAIPGAPASGTTT